MRDDGSREHYRYARLAIVAIVMGVLLGALIAGLAGGAEPPFSRALVTFAIAHAQAGEPPVCDGSETPCDPDRPWMRGRREKGCNRTGVRPSGATIEWHKCDCKHACEREGFPDGVTQGRKWDPKCSARCNPKQCQCEHPCVQTEHERVVLR